MWDSLEKQDREGNGTPLQYSCLENPMDGGAWQAAAHGIRVGHDFHFSLSCIGEGNGNPLPCSCLENPRDGGAWWAAVYDVAQSRTRLKQLSSSSSREARKTMKACDHFLAPSNLQRQNPPWISDLKTLKFLKFIASFIPDFTFYSASHFLCFQQHKAVFVQSK